MVEIATELKLLNQRVDALPGQIEAMVKAQLTETLMQWNKEWDAKLEKWRLENDRKLQEWRKENDCKLEGWGKDNDRKLEGWGKDNDRKLEGWGKDNDRKLAEMERKIDARFDSQGRWFRWIAGLLVSILLAVIFT